MWKSIWPGVPEDEVPIGHVTNGVHFRSWISFEMNQLYDRYLGPKWREEHADAKLWQRVEGIPAEELWRTHERRRVRLVAFARQHLRLQLQRRGAPQSEIDAAGEVLDPDALTIGFARRFATYKRATLVLRDIERLERILNNAECPVQILFAGKAHPRDDAGKELIQRIIRLAQQKEFRRRLVFLEDYDMAMARCLVQGSDIWLNTPLRPEEASGTSGMKALANGAINLSILDGWWDEAWREAAAENRFVGWAIGRGESYDNAEYQDQVESAALYDLLEHDIVPAFYDRGVDGVPRRWIANMKGSISHLCPSFNMQRVVKQYAALLCDGAREIPTVDGGKIGARQGAGGLGFAHTGELGAGPRRAHCRVGGHGTGCRQPNPGPGVDPAGGNSHAMKSRWSSIWAGSTPAAKSRMAWRFPCNRRARARKDFVSSRRPRCRAAGAVCTATRCGFCPSTPTRPRPSCPESSLGRMGSESRRRRNPLALEAVHTGGARTCTHFVACLSSALAAQPPQEPGPSGGGGDTPGQAANGESGRPGRRRLRARGAKPGNASVPDRRRGRRKRAQ